MKPTSLFGESLYRLQTEPQSARVLQGYPIEADGIDPGQGRCRVTHILGAGSMGIVFAGKQRTQPGLWRDVAIKVSNIPLDGFPVDQVFASHTKEGRILARCNQSPGVVQLVDSFSVQKEPPQGALVMERCATTLDEVLWQQIPRHLSIDQIRSFALQLLMTLKHLKRLGIAHNDIRPENIGLQNLNEPGAEIWKLFDFSHASDAYFPRGPIDKAGRWYRPPEAELGNLAEGPAGDIFSLGCCLAKLATGEDLLDTGTEGDTLDSITHHLNLIEKRLGPIPWSWTMAKWYRDPRQPVSATRIGKIWNSLRSWIRAPRRPSGDSPLAQRTYQIRGRTSETRALIHLIETMVTYNKRATPEQALAHPFLRPNRVEKFSSRPIDPLISMGPEKIPLRLDQEGGESLGPESVEEGESSRHAGNGKSAA